MRLFSHRDVQFPQDGGIQSLVLHGHGHLVDAGHILALYHAFKFHVAEVCHLLAHIIAQMMFCAQHQDVGLYSLALQLLHTALCRLGLQFPCSMQIGYIGQMHVDGILAQLPSQLSDGFQKGCTLDVAYGASYLGDDEVKFPVVSQQLDVALYLVGDVRNHLYGLAQVITPSLLFYHVLIDTPRGDVVGLGGLYSCKPLIVSQVQVGLQSVHSHIAFPMLVGVQRSRVNVDIWVKLLYRDVVPSGLQ